MISFLNIYTKKLMLLLLPKENQVTGYAIAQFLQSFTSTYIKSI